jgi:hypothetical protein
MDVDASLWPPRGPQADARIAVQYEGALAVRLAMGFCARDRHPKGRDEAEARLCKR